MQDFKTLTSGFKPLKNHNTKKNVNCKVASEHIQGTSKVLIMIFFLIREIKMFEAKTKTIKSRQFDKVNSKKQNIIV